MKNRLASNKDSLCCQRRLSLSSTRIVLVGRDPYSHNPRKPAASASKALFFGLFFLSVVLFTVPFLRLRTHPKPNILNTNTLPKLILFFQNALPLSPTPDLCAPSCETFCQHISSYLTLQPSRLDIHCYKKKQVSFRISEIIRIFAGRDEH